MAASDNKNLKGQIPVILYEEASSRGSTEIPFPYIEVAKEGMMPPVLFIFEYRHTGEVEPDEKGREAPIVDQIPHKYVDMELLKEKLSPEVNDVVRVALGMKPLKEAQSSGQKILDKVYSKIDKNMKDETQAISRENSLAKALTQLTNAGLATPNTKEPK
jgi:hypothetical protein